MPDYKILNDQELVSSIQDLYSCCPNRAENIITESIKHGYIHLLQEEVKLYKREKELFERTCKRSAFSACDSK